MKKGKLVCGIGVNDADYTVQVKITVGRTEEGKVIAKCVWACPFYQTWYNVLSRCYKPQSLLIHPSYVGCSTTQDWHTFSNFKLWMEKQDWQGKQLDKDILFPGNKLYSPETCVFVDRRINSFIIESNKIRGQWPIGVSFNKRNGKYQSSCKDIFTGKNRYLGLHETPEQAHQAWLAFKLEQAKILASQQTDKRVAKALVERYENYKISEE